jgi:hypothetical protein
VFNQRKPENPTSAGRKARKSLRQIVGMKPYGKCQIKAIRSSIIAISVEMLLGIASARSDIIVDTGDMGQLSLHSAALAPSQWMAAEIDIRKDVNLTKIQGWIVERSFDDHSFGSGNVTVSLYKPGISTQGYSIPGTLMYSADVYVPNYTPLGWTGPSGLSWNLTPGAYWVTYEVHAGSRFWGFMPTGSSLTPLPVEWRNPPPAQWFKLSGDNNQIGVRVFGDYVSNVPEPPVSAGLFAIGTAALLLRGRKLVDLARRIRGRNRA